MHIIEVLKEEKQLMFQNLQKLEKEIQEKVYLERRVKDMDLQNNKLLEDIQSHIKKINEKDQKILE